MKKVFFIPGLGADSKSFQFLDLSFCEPCFVDWIPPNKRDTLETYAEKLFCSIANEEAIIVGVSLGGMLATEIAKQHPATKVIVISSSKTYHEIPAYLRCWRFLPVYKLHSRQLKNFTGGFVLSLVGARGKAAKKSTIRNS